jgi:uncharacterized membrane protein
MKPLTDKQLEISIAWLLGIGVLISATVVSAGGLLYLRDASRPCPDYSHFHSVQPSLRTTADILRGASRIESESLIQFGILILIATPIMRVALCIVGFGQQRDKLYIAISTSVFLILVYSLLHGGK